MVVGDCDAKLTRLLDRGRARRSMTANPAHHVMTIHQSDESQMRDR
jgi:hypothetical protein